MSTDEHIVGAEAIAKELRWSLSKFQKNSKWLQQQGIIFLDPEPITRRPKLWTWRNILQTFRIMQGTRKFNEIKK